MFPVFRSSLYLLRWFFLCLCGWGEGDVPESLRRIEKFLNTQIEFHELDLLDKPGLEKIFKKVKETYTLFILLYIILNLFHIHYLLCIMTSSYFSTLSHTMYPVFFSFLYMYYYFYCYVATCLHSILQSLYLYFFFFTTCMLFLFDCL